jgi:NAD(P)-dependent dehydrogenase (short-subunit alcohol dehydrogenase family)
VDSPRVALVTGANSGIGLAASEELARRGFLVVLGCRDRARGEAAVGEVVAKSGGRAELLLLDLASLRSVREAAAELKRRHPALSLLVNNAGLWNRQRRLTADGHESTFGVNHLGHYALTLELLDALKAGAPARIVNVSSQAHHAARWDWEDVQREKRWSGVRAYADSKLANVWFTRELARRLPPGVAVNAVHPGGIATGIFRQAPGPFRGLLDAVLPGPEKGAAPVVRVACDPALEGVSGRYFNRLKEQPPSAAGQDDVAAARLWELSRTLVG